MISPIMQSDVRSEAVFRTRFSAPFPPGYRASGVLLHVTSLPSPYGIGDVGPAAFAWVDQLVAAGQSWWQVLPLGPTGFGNSPYQALSSFAANPLVLSPERLMEEGLLSPDDVSGCSFPPEFVDFERVIPFKRRVLATAWRNFKTGRRPDLRSAFEHFCETKGRVQEEPALFLALRAKYRGASFHDWPAALARREASALEHARCDQADAIDEFRFGQLLVLRQWQELKNYANERGVRLLGDLPIFVARDSCDVWAEPHLFLVDKDSKPLVQAGVPPDYFSPQGQLWGNPIYDWEALRRRGYRWWTNRLQARLEYLDAIRIDHFRAFEAAWHVPGGARTAETGCWVPGPGADFLEKVKLSLGRLPLLAEDLGTITPAVTALREQFQLPGMRVLQFAFGGDPNDPHLPHHCVHNGVVYTGTHDNNTTRGWYDALPEDERRNFWNYLRRASGTPEEAVREMIRLAASTVAGLAIIPFPDLLGLGPAARMNVPGRPEGQWRWRCPCDEGLNTAAFQRLYEVTAASDRLAARDLGERDLNEWRA